MHQTLSPPLSTLSAETRETLIISQAHTAASNDARQSDGDFYRCLASRLEEAVKRLVRGEQ